jgi:hypothetical protein
LEWPSKIVSALKANDICSITFIPDSVIDRILKVAEKDPYFHLTTLAREEEGIGIITGEYFGGRYGVLMMQSAAQSRSYYLGQCAISNYRRATDPHRRGSRYRSNCQRRRLQTGLNGKHVRRF